MKEIVIKNLSYSYSEDTVTLNDVSLDIERGSFVAFIGHNGSGKSTLAKCLLGLLEAKGEIEIGGVKLSKDSVNQIREKVAIVFQNPDNQFVGATVEDDIAFGLENRQIDPSKMKSIIYEAAKEVGMENFLDKEPSRLSGGQKQRVAIAGVCALSPDVLILDESTSMLDTKGKKEIYELINKMRENNKDLTVILITHNVEETISCDKIFLLDSGKLIISDSPKNLYTNDEIINKYHLSVPFRYRLEKFLKTNKNIDISECKNYDEVAKKLWQSR